MMCLVVAVPMTNNWNMEKRLLLLIFLLFLSSLIMDNTFLLSPFCPLIYPFFTLADVSRCLESKAALWTRASFILPSAILRCLSAAHANAGKPRSSPADKQLP
jgi:hypothetical protein